MSSLFLAVLACVSSGRAQVDAHQYAAAVTTFQQCLKQNQDDETLYSELAAAMVLAGQPSSDVAKRAVAVAHTPAVRAASLVSLALAAEKDPDVVMAEEALLASLRLRPNAQAASELAKLDPKLSADPSFAASPMGGPYASLADACTGELPKATAAANAASRGKNLKCSCKPGAETIFTVGALFQATTTLSFDCGDGQVESFGAKTQDRWFVSIVAVGIAENAKRCSASARVDAILPYGPRITVGSKWNTSCGGGGMDKELEWAAVAAVGVGASGTPSLVGPVVIANDHSITLYDRANEEKVTLSKWALDAKLTQDGVLQLSGKPDGWSADALGKLVGKHALTFK